MTPLSDLLGLKEKISKSQNLTKHGVEYRVDMAISFTLKNVFEILFSNKF